MTNVKQYGALACLAVTGYGNVTIALLGLIFLTAFVGSLTWNVLMAFVIYAVAFAAFAAHRYYGGVLRRELSLHYVRVAGERHRSIYDAFNIYDRLQIGSELLQRNRTARIEVLGHMLTEHDLLRRDVVVRMATIPISLYIGMLLSHTQSPFSVVITCAITTAMALVFLSTTLRHRCAADALDIYCWAWSEAKVPTLASPQ